MFHARTRAALVVLVAATLLVAIPGQSYAIFHWFCPSCWGGARSTYYTPPYTSYAPAYSSGCSSCSSGCSSCYRPVTSYYAPSACSSCSSPVTSYYAPSGCSSCSLRPVTTYRPFYSWLSCRPQYTTSYRVVCSDPCPTSCCPTSCPSSCDSCGAAPSSGCPTGCAPITTTAPSNGSSTGETPRTYRSEKPAEEEPLRPEPDSSTGPSPLRTPHLINPEGQTAARPVRTAVYTREVYRPVPQSGLDSGGWRASHD